jgi:hypothetical protein
MRKRTIGIPGALVLAAAVSTGFAVACSKAQATSATAVTQQTSVPGTEITIAPPPADANPSLTPDQAWATFTAAACGAQCSTALPAAATVEIGSLTDPVGPYCGTGCDMWTTVNGISYRALNELAYGYYWSSCPAGSNDPVLECQNWTFLDANTGALIIGVMPQPKNAVPPPPSASSQPSS